MGYEKHSQNGPEHAVAERERLLIQRGYVRVYHDDPDSLRPTEYLIRVENRHTQDAFETRTVNVVHWLEEK